MPGVTLWGSGWRGGQAGGGCYGWNAQKVGGIPWKGEFQRAPPRPFADQRSWWKGPGLGWWVCGAELRPWNTGAQPAPGTVVPPARVPLLTQLAGKETEAVNSLLERKAVTRAAGQERGRGMRPGAGQSWPPRVADATSAPLSPESRLVCAADVLADGSWDASHPRIGND